MIKVIRLSSYFIFSLSCFGVAGYAFYFIFGEIVNPFQKKMAEGGLVIPIHFFVSGLALALVPFQMSHKLRRFSISTHRMIGWLYVFSVLIGGVSGLIMAFNATGGIWAKWGFGILAILWLSTTAIGITYAIKGQIAAHQRWMYRSIAITAGAISFRIFLGLGLGVFHLPFLTVYVPSSWLAWSVNLLICDVLLRVGARIKQKRVLA